MMIVVGFDPVARAVVAHEDGEPPFLDMTADGLIAKHFRDDGIVFVELRGQTTELFFYDPEGRPAAAAVTPAGLGRWTVDAC